MLTLRVLDELSQLEYEKLAKAHPEFFNLLDRVLEHEQAVISALEALVPLGGNQAAAPLNEVQVRLAKVQQAADKAGPPGGVYKSLHSLERRLQNLTTLEPSVLRELPANAASALSAFEVAYDAFLAQRNHKTTLTLLLAASDVRQVLQSLAAAALALVAAFKPREPVPEGYDEATLSFDTVQTPAEVARKLEAISRLYSELAYMLGVSEAEYPLVIRQLLAGSLLVTVLGSAAVIGLLVKVAVAGAKWVYGHVTADNQLAALPRGLEALNQAIGIRDKLLATGRDTSDLDAALDKAALTIAESLNELFKNEPHVHIGGETIGLASEDAQKLLANKKPKQLPPGGS